MTEGILAVDVFDREIQSMPGAIADERGIKSVVFSGLARGGMDIESEHLQKARIGHPTLLFLRLAPILVAVRERDRRDFFVKIGLVVVIEAEGRNLIRVEASAFVRGAGEISGDLAFVLHVNPVIPHGSGVALI